MSSTLATLKPNFPPTPMSKRFSTPKNFAPKNNDKPKVKKFYTVNEIVWIKPLKHTGIVVEINPENKDIVIDYFDESGVGARQTFKLWQVDKARSPKSKTEKVVSNDALLFAKVNPNATIPSKRDEDGCYDVYACFEEDQIAIEPGQMVLIPLGIASAFSSKFRFELRERGSTGTKCMARRAGQIDSGYRDEWFFPLNNTGNKTIIIAKNVAYCQMYNPTATVYPYEKAIGQAALEIVPRVKTNEISYDELLAIKSERGIGKLGSSNK